MLDKSYDSIVSCYVNNRYDHYYGYLPSFTSSFFLFGFLYSTEHEFDIQVFTPIFGSSHLFKINHPAMNSIGPIIDSSCIDSP